MRQFIPKFLLIAYHTVLTWLSAVWYGFPSRHMITIGITGTDGKTSTTDYLSQILEAAGFKTGYTTTAAVKVGSRVKINDRKMTMPGRWHLQKLLKKIKDDGAAYALVETTSSGLEQNRHQGIAYDAAVFTNLSREHIEIHGSYQKYRQAKEKLFAVLSKTKKKPGVKKISVVNVDDHEAPHFLSYDADEKWGFGLEPDHKIIVEHLIKPLAYSCGPNGITFSLPDNAGRGGGSKASPVVIKTRLVGLFNLKNMLAAVAVARSQGINLTTIKRALEKITPTPGRMEPINEGQDFSVIVDYAHAPAALELAYQALRAQLAVGKKIIAVLGSAGGGRDKAKRPLLGQLAAKYADFAVITNEDPYDEDPTQIINQVAAGLVRDGKKEGRDFIKILDRKKGIATAIKKAGPGDIVIITGKGCEPVMAVKGGQKIPHDDRKVAREALRHLLLKKRKQVINQ